DIIDLETFSQILDMDDDEEREFSKTIVFEFFEQAEKTIIDMREGLRMKDLGVLSSLGHFLKGSSATLGLIKIKNACEAIQHLGAGQDEFGRKIDTDPKESLNQIQKKLDE
ncbi:osomolarity two-component system, phosphorelay intermediate protein YPD1, partial [Terfezia claveryi]